MTDQTVLTQQYIDELNALAHESQLIKKEIFRTIRFEHLHKKIKGIKQQIDLIHATIVPRTFAEKAHFEHLHHTALSLIAHHLKIESHYLESLKENDEFWEQVKKLQESILEEIEHLKAATEFESALTESLSEFNEQTETLLASLEEHQTQHPHMEIHKHIAHLKHQVHKLHHAPQHPNHDVTHSFLDHYHDTLEEIILNMHHLQHRMNEIRVELKEENEKIAALKEIEEEIETMRLAYEEQQKAAKEAQEHHYKSFLGPNFKPKKDAY